jgi:hypothetical protein
MILGVPRQHSLFLAACQPEYRAYLIGWDGHIIHRVDLVCPDDEAAKGRAKRLVDGHAVELWQEGRKVAQFDPED